MMPCKKKIMQEWSYQILEEGYKENLFGHPSIFKHNRPTEQTETEQLDTRL